MTSDIEIQQRIKELVLARLKSTPPSLGIVVGTSSGQSLTFSALEMVKQVEDNTEVGLDYVELEIDFLRSLKDGLLTV